MRTAFWSLLLLPLLVQDADIFWQWSCSNGSPQRRQSIWLGWHGSSSHFHVQATVEPGEHRIALAAVAARPLATNVDSSSLNVYGCVGPAPGSLSFGGAKMSGSVDSRAGCSRLVSRQQLTHVDRLTSLLD
jgi:hypothetical protein